MEDVGVRFSGNSTGAVGAARKTATAIEEVKHSATGSSAPLRGMEKDLGRVERGALAGSGAFKGLGRSVAFASGAFLGAAGFAEVLKHSIDVTLAAQTSITHLDQAVKNAHASVKAMTPILEAHAAAARKLGFEDNDTRDAEAKLVTAFGATKQALDELRVAQDLSRASNIPLGDATRQLILLQEGNTRAAKQFGLSLPDLTKKQWEAKAAADGLNLSQEKGKTLYDELLPRIKDQAAAYANTPAGKIAEFHAQITHLEESIGTGLLPVVDQYLTAVDDWLAKGKNQKTVTDDVRKAADTLVGVLGDLKGEIDKVKPVAEEVVKAFGGWKKVIEDLILLKVASTVLGWAAAFKKLGGAEGIAGAEASAGGLLGKLSALKKIGAIGIALSLIPQAPNTPSNYGNHNPVANWFGNLPVVGGLFSQANRLAGAIDQKLGLYGGGSSTGGGAGLAAAETPTQKKELAYASKYGPGSGITYTWGGVSPITGFDCSGYLMASYAAAGVSIPHNTVAQFNDPHAIVVLPGGEQPGDGVYFKTDGPGAAPQHVGIYIGGGRFIEYFSQGKPAKISDLATSGGYMGARRWLKIASGGSTGSTSSPYGPSQQSGGGTGGASTAPTKTKWVGATQATITSAQGSVSALLRGLPADLDPVEKNAVAHIRAIKDNLHIHMTPAELAKDRVELTRWGKVLHDEIGKNAKVVAAAAAAAKKQYDQALSIDTSKILRQFDQAFQGQMRTFDNETSDHLRGLQEGFALQMQAFDRETQKGLQALAVAQTPEEKALADFVAKRAADDQAKSRADQLANASTPEEKAALALGFSLDDQQAALQQAADASRVAADAKTADDQQAYQDQRDAAKQALQDKEADAERAYGQMRDDQKTALGNINDDQRTLLEESLTDWTTNIGKKKSAWTDFLTWLQNSGFDTSGLVDPNVAASLADPAGAVSPGGDPRGSTRLGTAIGFAAGGKVPGRYVGRQDTIMARLTPGETVIDRQLTAALEEMVANGGGGGSTVAVFDINGHRFAQATARPMTDEQARQIGYTIQRG